MASQLTSLLSQYELLTMLCGNLSSADIVHLGATSKEHWQYIGHNPAIFKGLISESTCDGKGIIAQARVFGHWQAKPEKATRECRGKDAKPCSDCGAMVCNDCRFHLTYLNHADGPSAEAEAWYDAWYEDWGIDWDWDKTSDETWDLEELIISAGVNDEDIREEHVTRQVELVKAIRMLHMRDQTYCEDCEPLLVNPGLKEWCICDIHSHFVESWRCISCVLTEETNLVTSQQKYTMLYDPNEIRGRRWMYKRLMMCKCGKRTTDEPTQTCKWCGKISGYYAGRDAHFLKRVQEQLGSWVDTDRSNDALLSQLG